MKLCRRPCSTIENYFQEIVLIDDEDEEKLRENATGKSFQQVRTSGFRNDDTLFGT